MFIGNLATCQFPGPIRPLLLKSLNSLRLDKYIPPQQKSSESARIFTCFPANVDFAVVKFNKWLLRS